MRAMGLPSFYRKDWAKVHDKQMYAICDRKISYADSGIRRQAQYQNGTLKNCLEPAYWVCQDSGNTHLRVTYRGAKRVYPASYRKEHLLRQRRCSPFLYDQCALFKNNSKSLAEMPHHNRHPLPAPLCEGVVPFIQAPVIYQCALAHRIILYNVADWFLT